MLRSVNLVSKKSRGVRILKGWKTDVEPNSLGFTRDGGGHVCYYIVGKNDLPFDHRQFVENHIYLEEVEVDGEMRRDISIWEEPCLQIGDEEIGEPTPLSELKAKVDNDILEELSSFANIFVDANKKTITAMTAAQLSALLNKKNVTIVPAEYDHLYDD